MLTQAEIGRRLGVSSQRVYQLIHQGKLEADEWGHVDEKELEDFLSWRDAYRAWAQAGYKGKPPPRRQS